MRNKGLTEDKQMQQNDPHQINAWYVRGCIMSAVVMVTSWASVDFFAPTRNELWLYQFFVVITFVSATATVLFAGLTLEAILRKIGHEWSRGISAGLPLSVLLRPFSATVVAVLASLLSSRFFDSKMMIFDVGVISFVIFLLAPLVDKVVIKRRQVHDNVKNNQSAETAVTRTVPSSEQASKAPNIGIVNGAASESISSAESAAVSNVVVNVVLPTQEGVIEKAVPQDGLEKENIYNLEGKTQDASVENHPKESSVYEDEKQTANTNSGVIMDDEPAYYQGEEIVLPVDFQSIKNKYALRTVFAELVKAQVLDIHLQPISISNVQMSLLVDALSEMFDIPRKWKTFEEFWHVNNLSQSHNQATSTQLDEDIYHALAEAEKNIRVASIIKVKRWMDRYRRKYNIKA